MRLIYFILFNIFVVPVIFGCNEKPSGSHRSVQVELSQTLASTNEHGDVAYNYLECEQVGYFTDTRDYGTVVISTDDKATMSASIEVKSGATSLWCYTPGQYGLPQGLSVPARLSKKDHVTADTVEGMIFLTESISLSQNTVRGTIVPLTSGVVLDIIDSEGNLAGKTFKSVQLQTNDDTALAGQITMNLFQTKIEEVTNPSSLLNIDCPGFTVGTASDHTSIGATVLPCDFVGTITVFGDDFNLAFTISEPIVFQAGYVKHITLDLAKAGQAQKQLPKRLGILGDSISTFEDMIPSDHRTYYTNPASSGCNVDTWKETYWGLLITKYWECELDMNSSWSGSSVADGREGDYRMPFVDRNRLDLFKNPDTIILFGGSNDCQEKYGIGLGEFSYDVPLSQMNTYKRFRDAYIYVIRYLREKHPNVTFICVIGTHMTDALSGTGADLYAESVKEIAKHYGCPCVDFRNDSKVTFWKTSHPNEAGFAHMAQRIYEETLNR